jgi:hypothetical protein
MRILPEPCPIVPLGTDRGVSYLIDSRGKFWALEAEQFTRALLEELFADAPEYPRRCWPRDADGRRFDTHETRATLFLGCSRAGIIDARGAERAYGEFCTLLAKYGCA